MSTTMAVYAVYAFFVSFTSFLIHGVSADQVQITNSNPPNNCSNSGNILICEIQEMNQKVARLELLLEVTDQELLTKDLYIENCEKKIDEISRKTCQLESFLANLKGLQDDEQVLYALEEEVRTLEIDVGRNDMELHLLKERAKDAEERVSLLASQVKMMANIIPELWFQVQKLEQAHEVIERRTAELRKHIRNHRCTFFKFINNLFSIQHQEMVSTYTSEAIKQLRWSLSAFKKYHHQLQGFVRQEMNRSEFTALLADDELIFFLASAVVVFPLMLALIWLPSLWR